MPMIVPGAQLLMTLHVDSFYRMTAWFQVEGLTFSVLEEYGDDILKPAWYGTAALRCLSYDGYLESRGQVVTMVIPDVTYQSPEQIMAAFDAAVMPKTVASLITIHERRPVQPWIDAVGPATMPGVQVGDVVKLDTQTLLLHRLCLWQGVDWAIERLGTTSERVEEIRNRFSYEFCSNGPIFMVGSFRRVTQDTHYEEYSIGVPPALANIGYGPVTANFRLRQQEQDNGDDSLYAFEGS